MSNAGTRSRQHCKLPMRSERQRRASRVHGAAQTRSLASQAAVVGTLWHHQGNLNMPGMWVRHVGSSMWVRANPHVGGGMWAVVARQVSARSGLSPVWRTAPCEAAAARGAASPPRWKRRRPVAGSQAARRAQAAAGGSLPWVSAAWSARRTTALLATTPKFGAADWRAKHAASGSRKRQFTRSYVS